MSNGPGDRLSHIKSCSKMPGCEINDKSASLGVCVCPCLCVSVYVYFHSNAIMIVVTLVSKRFGINFGNLPPTTGKTK